jgi:sugar O-acyltransferase (sialic acid O-acetyltransferase NeuD family)
MEKIVVFGAGGHAKVVIDTIEKHRCYEISAVYDTDRDKCEILGYPIIHDLEQVNLLDIQKGIVAIGHNWTRSLLVAHILKLFPELTFVTAIHPFTAIGKNVRIGEGTVVMAGCCINTDSVIGRHCIINTRASIDHENIVHDFANVSPGVTTGGNVVLGEYSFIGIGANIIQKSTIGAHAFVGAGSTVLRNIPEKTMSFGLPCKVIRSTKIGDKFV